jgi:hypothetical protein
MPQQRGSSSANSEPEVLSFRKAEREVEEIFAALSPDVKADLQTRKDVLIGFLEQFPKDFTSPVPYPENNPGRYVYAVTGPPRPWP